MLTYLLIGINVLVSLIGFSRMNSGAGGRMFFFSPSEVSAGRNYQGMLLSHFAHADGTHLLFNMVTLWMFGSMLEQDWGTRRFLKYYFLCGVGAGLCDVLVNAALGNWIDLIVAFLARCGDFAHKCHVGRFNRLVELLPSGIG